MAEIIEMPFGLWTQVGPRNYTLNGECTLALPDELIEQFVCGGDAALCQDTLTTCILFMSWQTHFVLV